MPVVYDRFGTNGLKKLLNFRITSRVRSKKTETIYFEIRFEVCALTPIFALFINKNAFFGKEQANSVLTVVKILLGDTRI